MEKTRDRYGSQWHLMRSLAHHRNEFDPLVCNLLGADGIQWLDSPYKGTGEDGEWMGWISYLRLIRGEMNGNDFGLNRGFNKIGVLWGLRQLGA